MKKSKKIDNILIERKIRELAKSKNLKINEKAINELNVEVSKFVESLLDSANHILTLEGRKVIKKKDIQEAKKNLEKKEQDFEI